MTTQKVTTHRRYDRHYEELDYAWQGHKFIATCPDYPKFRSFAYVSQKEFAVMESKRLALIYVNREFMEFLDREGISLKDKTIQCGRCFQHLLPMRFEVYATGSLNPNCRQCCSDLTLERIKRRKKK